MVLKVWHKKGSRSLSIILIFLLTISLLAGCSTGQTASSSSSASYWPTDGWLSSTPEAQGMDSGKIAEMFDTINTFNYDFHHVLVIRNGYKVAETSYYPYQPQDVHNIFSITKDFTSALVGKAIEEGYIKGVDEPVMPYFSDYQIQNLDEQKKSITIKHMLTMSSGLEWFENGDYTSSRDSNTQMWGSDDQLQYVLDRPMAESPGSTFNYATGGTHLLSGLLSKAIEKPVAAYAKEKLWEPMGIKTAFWATDNQGYNAGGSRSLYTAEDLAKFGYLYLNEGQWDGQQLISKDWVKESTTKWMDTPNGPAGLDGYGYQWWMNPFGGYSGRGYAGQFLFVLPEQNMVVVFFGSLKGGNYFKPEHFVKNFLIPACVSDKALPENPAGQESLTTLLEAAKLAPETEVVQPLPEVIKQTNGKIFNTENGETIGIDFETGKNTATLHWFTDGVQYDVPVGLDNSYRFSDCKNFYLKDFVSKTGFKGRWEDDSTFAVDIRPLESDCNYTLTLSFEDQGIVTDFHAN